MIFGKTPNEALSEIMRHAILYAMLWAVLAAPLMLMGCGFKPILATHQNAAPANTILHIALDLPNTLLGQMLHDALAAQITLSPQAKFRAKINLSESRRNIFINRAGQKQRQELMINVQLIIQAGTKQRQEVQNFNVHDSFDAIGDELTKQLALEASRQRLIDNLADALIRALTAYIQAADGHKGSNDEAESP